MNRKAVIAVGWILLIAGLLTAMESVTFLKKGNKVADTVVDMSSRTGNVQYAKHAEIHRSNIWMINYVNDRWDFPKERQLLPEKLDIIFLRNDTYMVGEIVDFSSKRMVWEFKDGRFVKEHRVRRIYFCCTKFPQYYHRLFLRKKGIRRSTEKIRKDG